MLRYLTLLLAAGLAFAGLANADVTLYQVSASNADPDAPSVSIDISYTVSAVGTAEYGAATTYVAEEVMSREQAIYSTKTATLISEPTTFTRTFIQGASTYALALTAPEDTTTLSDENGQPTATSTRTRLLEGYSIGCNLNSAAGDGSCEVSIDGPGTQRTYTGPLTPFYTLTSENGVVGGLRIKGALFGRLWVGRLWDSG
ncbi:hypothetical protein K523DRAFT_382079 [Schizophyllum commune Tattone D]|nr:hypothetical protein K523DRAFT_382079 [Schizophyllum commune Tattone D]